MLSSRPDRSRGECAAGACGKRRRLHLVAPQDLELFLERERPAGILTGFEDEALEKPLLEYADRHAYRHRLLRKKRHLWLAPTGLRPSDTP
jgi:hypothetical protein